VSVDCVWNQDDGHQKGDLTCVGRIQFPTCVFMFFLVSYAHRLDSHTGSCSLNRREHHALCPYQCTIIVAKQWGFTCLSTAFGCSYSILAVLLHTVVYSVDDHYHMRIFCVCCTILYCGRQCGL
jgi:hypothetical protein